MDSVLNFFYGILNNGYTKIASSLLVILLIFMMLKIKPFRYFIPIVMIGFAIYNIYTDYNSLSSCIYCAKNSCKVLCNNNYSYIIPAILYLAFAIGFSIYDYLNKKYNKLDNKKEPLTNNNESKVKVEEQKELLNEEKNNPTLQEKPKIDTKFYN